MKTINKYDATIKLLGIVAAALLLIPIVTQASMPTAIAQTASDDMTKFPALLSKAEEDQLTKVALSDQRVQEKIEGKSYEPVGVGFFTDNINIQNPIWQPVVHINIKDIKSIAVFLDSEKKAVVKIEETPWAKLTHLGATFASNYYTGSSTVKGLLMTSSAPTYTTGGTTNTLTAFLLNAVELNADISKLCNPAYYATSYWAQVGFVWTTSTEAVVWADTATSCAPQSTGLSYAEGNSYEYKVYTSGSTWYIVAKNVNSGATYTKTRTGITYVAFKTNEFNTGIFFENQNTGTTWYTKYASPYVVSATAKYSSTSGGTSWSNWESGAKQDQLCNDSRQSDTVISGNVASGGTGTWNLQTMSTIHC